LQFGQTFPIVTNLHFLQAISRPIFNLPQLLLLWQIFRIPLNRPRPF
jgi:hypothetical protein